MPYTGEEPITNFFPRITSLKKRTENIRPAPSSAKRRPSRVRAEANPSPTKKAKVATTAIVFRDAPSHEAQPQPRAFGAQRDSINLRRVPDSPPSPNVSRDLSVTPPPIMELLCSGSGPTKHKPTSRRTAASWGNDGIIDLSMHQDLEAGTSRSAAAKPPRHDFPRPTPIISRRSSHITSSRSLLTPPPTNQPKDKRATFSFVAPHPTPTAPPRTHERRGTMSLPTPGTVTRRVVPPPKSLLVAAEVGHATLGLPVTSICATSGPKDEETVFSLQKNLMPHRVEKLDRRSNVRDKDYEQDPFVTPELSVPSSQTQDYFYNYLDAAHSIIPSSPSAFISHSRMFKPPHIQAFGASRTTTCAKSAPALEGRASSDDQRVPSSQSQHILPYTSMSPRQRRVGTEPPRSHTLVFDAGLALDDFVPSSQSQIEKEMSIPIESSGLLTGVDMNVSPRDDDECDSPISTKVITAHPRPSSYSKFRSRNVASARTPARTHSEELFAFPVQDQDFADMFLEDNQSQQPGDIDFPIVNRHLEDSATESDSEAEPLVGDVYASGGRKATRSLTNVVRGASVPLLSSSPSCAPLNGDLDEWQDTDPTESEEELLLTRTDPDFSGSLPDAVKDFRDMFDGGEGSYPADFPMSLR